MGRLCGDCDTGYVEAIGSIACVPQSQCDGDRPVVWTVAVVGVIAAACAQLAVVSDVWLPSKRFPSSKLKLTIYFLQVCHHARLAHSNTRTQHNGLYGVHSP